MERKLFRSLMLRSVPYLLEFTLCCVFLDSSSFSSNIQFFFWRSRWPCLWSTQKCSNRDISSASKIHSGWASWISHEEAYSDCKSFPSHRSVVTCHSWNDLGYEMRWWLQVNFELIKFWTSRIQFNFWFLGSLWRKRPSVNYQRPQDRVACRRLMKPLAVLRLQWNLDSRIQTGTPDVSNLLSEGFFSRILLTVD